MTPANGNRRATHGFTLIELLVVIGIIAVLASMLLPAMFSTSMQVKVANTEALLKRVAVALEMYSKSCAYYPPDFIPVDAYIINFQGRTTGSPPAYVRIKLVDASPGANEALGPAYPPEALYYYLSNAFLSPDHPMLRVHGTAETTDVNQNGLPEIVDAWARPILYNRPKFPGYASGWYDNSVDPYHNANTYDLYSVGPDGQTGGGDLPTIAPTTLPLYCDRAINGSTDGEGDDDIRNWTK